MRQISLISPSAPLLNCLSVQSAAQLAIVMQLLNIYSPLDVQTSGIARVHAQEAASANPAAAADEDDRNKDSDSRSTQVTSWHL